MEVSDLIYEYMHSPRDESFLISKKMIENFNYHLHLHENCEFVYVESGKMRITISGQPFIIEAGDGALIFPGQPHDFYTPEYSKCWVAIFSTEHIPEIKAMVREKKYFSPVIKPKSQSLFSDFHSAADNIFRLRSMLYELLAIYADGESAPTRLKEGGELVCRIAEYISLRSSESISLKHMAQDMGYSYKYMSAVVNKFFDMPLPEVVSRYRVSNACALITNTQKPITEIALSCGFGSIRNFNRSFKQIVGVTPKEYRATRHAV